MCTPESECAKGKNKAEEGKRECWDGVVMTSDKGVVASLVYLGPLDPKLYCVQLIGIPVSVK